MAANIPQKHVTKAKQKSMLGQEALRQKKEMRDKQRQELYSDERNVARRRLKKLTQPMVGQTMVSSKVKGK